MLRNAAMKKLIFIILLISLANTSYSQSGPNDAVYGRFSSGVLGYATSVNLNSVADTTVTIKATKYIIRKVTVTNCSATPVLAQVALYTAVTAGGTNFVAATVLTTLSATTALVDLTLINVTTTVLTASSQFVRNTVAQTTALTCDVYIIGDSIP